MNQIPYNKKLLIKITDRERERINKVIEKARGRSSFNGWSNKINNKTLVESDNKKGSLTHKKGLNPVGVSSRKSDKITPNKAYLTTYNNKIHNKYNKLSNKSGIKLSQIMRNKGFKSVFLWWNIPFFRWNIPFSLYNLPNFRYHLLFLYRNSLSLVNKVKLISSVWFYRGLYYG